MRFVVPVAVVLLTLFADQASKAWARSALPAGQPVSVIDGYWDWELAFNPGAAFSMFGDGTMRVVLSIFGVAATAVIAWMIARSRPDRRVERIALAMIAGGAAGNLVDRIGSGVVTDFVRWRVHDHRWPIFNVADAALLVGVAVLLVDGWRQRRGPPAGAKVGGDG
jgi:signal peptidase II